MMIEKTTTELTAGAKADLTEKKRRGLLLLNNACSCEGHSDMAIVGSFQCKHAACWRCRGSVMSIDDFCTLSSETSWIFMVFFSKKKRPTSNQAAIEEWLLTGFCSE
jgi:hypothetical protein